jgi:hypothetical protein
MPQRIRTPSRTSPAFIIVPARPLQIAAPENKAVSQHRCDLGVSVDSSLTTLLDLAVADATVRSYRRPPPLCPPPAATTPEEPQPQENSSELLASTHGPRGAEAVDSKTSPYLEETRIILPPLGLPPPRFSGQPFAIEHRVHEK